MATRCLTLGMALALATVSACSDDGHEGAGGAGGTSSSAAETGSLSSASLGTTTCDDIEFCGDASDPGCPGCAVTEGLCSDEVTECDETTNDACNELAACYPACPPDDPVTLEVDERAMCVETCELQHPLGKAPLEALIHCVYCEECPVSCATEPTACADR